MGYGQPQPLNQNQLSAQNAKPFKEVFLDVALQASSAACSSGGTMNDMKPLAHMP